MRAEGPAPDPLAPLIEALHEEGRLRVWSLVVTVFGDAVAPRGGRIATSRLGALTGRIGVGEGALRTALSRLVAEGTLEREREGRASFHRLSGRAMREARAASAVIYAPPAGPDGWTMGTGPAPLRALELPGGAWLSREAPPEGAIAVTGGLVGGAGIAPAAAHRRALDRLARDLGALGRLLSETAEATPPRGDEAGLPERSADLPAHGPELAPLDAVAARTLLIHRWRRIALRWPDLPEASAAPGAPGAPGAAERSPATRSAVAASYRALLGASEAWLDDAMVGPIGSQAARGEAAGDAPRSIRSVERRFG